jgi:dethiobiotin synthetase
VRAFVTGTDTGVGKTYVTALLTRALRRAGLDTVALKPLCCGPREDVTALCAAMDNELPADAVNPCWLQAPAAPLVAARDEGVTVDLAALEAWFAPYRDPRRSVLVEGAGGWLVPMADGRTMADLAVTFGLPVLVVIANKLGCLNHTLLTVESIRARGLACAGLILNTPVADASRAAATNAAVLREFCDVPILFEIAAGQRDLELAVG